MATATFFHRDLQEDNLRVVLSPAESLHAAKARRLRVGSQINILNGQGLLALGSIATIESRAVSVDVEGFEKQQLPARIIIATAIPKGDRQRTMIDMLTQLGVTDIVPLQCEHSVTKFKTNMLEKWQRLAIEACKQSCNPWLPKFHDEVNVSTFINDVGSRCDADRSVFYADACGENMHTLLSKKTAVALLIGPEGGFSKAEVGLFKKSNIHAVRIASSILRTELAAISAAAQIAGLYTV